jgi:hypothetical protein
MRLLGFYENVGVVVWFSRLQSGAVKVVKGWKNKRHEHYMQLCRKGTPDIMAVLNDGTVLWLELKTKTGTIRPEQEEFRSTMSNVKGHLCLIVRGAEEIEKLLEEYKKGRTNDNHT